MFSLLNKAASLDIFSCSTTASMSVQMHVCMCVFQKHGQLKIKAHSLSTYKFSIKIIFSLTQKNANMEKALFYASKIMFVLLKQGFPLSFILRISAITRALLHV